MKNCAFCRIVAGETPADLLFESDEALAFLSIAPLAKGHCLVIPKAHRPALSALSEEVAGRLMGAVSAVAAAVMRETDSDGFNLLVANGPCAGQAVPHLCVEIIPRVQTDGLAFPVHSIQYNSEAERQEIVGAIRKRLEK
jgi:histidine triad (HIT) family protein